MHESLYRQSQAVKRMFGTDAVLGGTLGTPSRPGRMEIILDNQQIAVGANFEQALQAASRQLARKARTCPDRFEKS